MKIIGQILIILLCICCNTSQLDFNVTSSGEIIHYEFDSYGNIIDTLPSYVKQIKRYSIDNSDTSRVLLPNSKSAINYARYVLDTTYGRIKMISEKPFKITLIDNKYWYITGTTPKKYKFGGSAEILISKYDGEILYLSHGK